jgi:nucleoside-diphosphate-sugar epimerase
LLSRRITPEQKLLLKSRLQGRSAYRPPPDARPVKMPSEGRVVREAYRSWVTNDLAKTRLGWKPAHSFALGAKRTGEWLRFARLV